MTYQKGTFLSDLIPFDLAMAVGDKGFTFIVDQAYNAEGEIEDNYGGYPGRMICWAPTYAEVLDWLREYHKIEIYITPHILTYGLNPINQDPFYSLGKGGYSVKIVRYGYEDINNVHLGGVEPYYIESQEGAYKHGIDLALIMLPDDVEMKIFAEELKERRK